MAFECDGFVFGEIEERDFVVSAGEEYVRVELIDIYHVSVLVRMEFVGVLVCFVLLVVSVLQDETVGIPAKKSIIERLYFVEYGWGVTDAEALGVEDLCWLWHGHVAWRLFIVHYYIFTLCQ